MPLSHTGMANRPRFAYWRFREWIIPRRILLLIFGIGSLLTFLGFIMVLVGGGVSTAGAILLGIGLSLLAVAFLICMYACLMVNEKEQYVQTTEDPYAGGYLKEIVPTHLKNVQEVPLLKSYEIYRNGGLSPGQQSPKKVRMAPGTINNEKEPTYKPILVSPRSSEPVYAAGDHGGGSMNRPQGQSGYISQEGQTLVMADPMYRPSFGQQGPMYRHAAPQSEPRAFYQMQQAPTGRPVSYHDGSDRSGQFSTVAQAQSGGIYQKSTYDDVPPPQPLVRPSERRPMTFEQMSSSKVSLYDNMQMANLSDD